MHAAFDTLDPPVFDIDPSLRTIKHNMTAITIPIHVETMFVSSYTLQLPVAKRPNVRKDTICVA